MELTGNAADRWEQISNKLGELANSVSAKQELVEGISSTLNELRDELKDERKMLEQLSGLALKEVLREESGTLNDEVPETSEIQKVKSSPEQKPKPKSVPRPQTSEKTSISAQKEKLIKNQPAKIAADKPKESETLPLLEVVDTVVTSSQPESQVRQKES